MQPCCGGQSHDATPSDPAARRSRGPCSWWRSPAPWVALDLSIVNVAFPSVEASFPEVSTTALSWVLSAYSVVFGALLLGTGRIADRWGRRRWFLRGVGVFTLGSLLCGVATTLGC